MCTLEKVLDLQCRYAPICVTSIQYTYDIGDRGWRADWRERYAIKGGCPLTACRSRAIRLLPFVMQKWGKHINGKWQCGTQSDRNCEVEDASFFQPLSGLATERLCIGCENLSMLMSEKTTLYPQHVPMYRSLACMMIK